MSDKVKPTYTEEEIRQATRKANKDMIMEYLPYVIILITIIIIRIFIASPVRVDGSSMDPTLKNGDFMILYKLQKRVKGINRFDIIVADADSTRLVKRIIGLPGDTIRYEVSDKEGYDNGYLYINGELVEETFIDMSAKAKTCVFETELCSEEGITLKEDEYFVMGDNRGVSKDSRLLGPISYKDIEGIAKLRVFPFTKMGNVK